MKSSFISYAREDFSTAKRLYQDLKSADVNAWLDQEDLLPGQDRRRVIEDTIRRSAYVIILMSKHSAGHDLQSFQAPTGLPEGIFEKISFKAESDYPTDFSGRLDQIDEETSAYRDLQSLRAPSGTPDGTFSKVNPTTDEDCLFTDFAEEPPESVRSTYQIGLLEKMWAFGIIGKTLLSILQLVSVTILLTFILGGVTAAADSDSVVGLVVGLFLTFAACFPVVHFLIASAKARGKRTQS